MNQLGLIVLNYNSAHDTINCVSRLLEIEENYKIIVVDNCSTDDSFQVLKDKFENSKIVDLIKTDANKGYSAGNNFGIKYAIEKYGTIYIGILNPDVVITDKTLINKMINILDRYPKAAIIGGATLNPEGTYDENIAAWNVPTGRELVIDHMLFLNRKKRLLKNEIEKDVYEVGCVLGCFFLSKVDFLNKIGLLDENVFLYNEENILGLKCKQAGYKVLLYAKGFYIHNHCYKKNELLPFKKKVMASHNSYISRRYLCKKYYPAYILPMLDGAETLNKAYLSLAYVKSKIGGILSEKRSRNIYR